MLIQTDGVMPELPEEDYGELSLAEAGIAVDVGTSTVAMSLWSLAQKKCLACVAEKNSQMRYGYDVIRRISYASRKPVTGSSQTVESGPSALHYCIISQLEKMFSKLVALSSSKVERGCRINVRRIVITGNTTMLSFVCGFPVDTMAAAPFKVPSYFGFSASWNDVRLGKVNDKCVSLDSPTPQVLQLFSSSVIEDDTAVYFPPCVGAFIGADLICSMLSAGFPSPKADSVCNSWELPAKAPILLADIGTNSEIALFIPPENNKDGKILCTSAAAGPAFEAANIDCGMSSVPGAIDRIDCNGELACHVIGDIPAKGICGSGLISGCATLLRHRFIDRYGVIQKAVSKLADGAVCISLTPAVYISQQDIRNMQLAKSAVFTGLSYMIERSPSVPVFCVAGGFGSHINMEDACAVGLVPEKLKDRCVNIGNGALQGAAALLFSKKLRYKAVELAKFSFQINLAAVPDFQNRYISAIDFP